MQKIIETVVDDVYVFKQQNIVLGTCIIIFKK